MSLRIDFYGPWNPQIQAQIESALRTCIGAPADGEEWTVLVGLLGILWGSGKNPSADPEEAVSGSSLKAA